MKLSKIKFSTKLPGNSAAISDSVCAVKLTETNEETVCLNVFVYNVRLNSTSNSRKVS